MSYPSVAKILQEQGLSISNVTDKQLIDVYWEAFQIDLPLGVEYVIDLYQKLESKKIKFPGCKIVYFILAFFGFYINVEGESVDPNSERGKQIIRLSYEIPRRIIKEKLGFNFSCYNCCIGNGSTGGGKLSLQRQAQIQSGFTDC